MTPRDEAIRKLARAICDRAASDNDDYRDATAILALVESHSPEREALEAAIEVDRYFRAHPEVLARHNTMDGFVCEDGTSPYESLWHLKDALAALTPTPKEGA